MKTITVSLDHPILFIFDFSNKALTVPELEPEEPSKGNRNCVSIRAVSHVDGEVTVTLSNDMPNRNAGVASEIFTGTITVPNRKVAVVTGENIKLVEVPVAMKDARIVVYVDDPLLATRIWVEAK